MINSPCLEDAIKLIKLGLAVVPLPPKRKIPFIKKWQTEPFVTEERLRAHFAKDPNAGLGLVMGYGRLCGIDLDFPGVTAEDLKKFPRTWTVKSRNGFHLYFLVPEGVFVAGGSVFPEHAKHAHLYTTGRQFVAPPTVIYFDNDGMNVGPFEYFWFSDAGGELSPWEMERPALLPEWCGKWEFPPDSCQPVELKPLSPEQIARGNAAVRSLTQPPKATVSAEKAVNPRNKKYGPGERHPKLEDIATAMRKRGEDRDKILSELWLFGARKCLPPMLPPGDTKEIEGIADWAVKTVEIDPVAVEAYNRGPGRPKGPSAWDLAVSFMEEHGFISNGQTCVRYYRDDFYLWNGTFYQAVEDSFIRARVNSWLERSGNGEFCGTNKVKAIMECMQSGNNFVQREVVLPAVINDQSGEIRSVRHFVPLQNGIFDVKRYCETGEVNIRPHTPEFFSTYCLPFAFDPAATCPKFEEIERFTFGTDLEKKLLWEEILGIHFYQPATIEKFFVLQGEGANGKSVLVNVMTALFGPRNISTVPLECFTPSSFAFHTTLGKIANIISDQNDIEKIEEGNLKQFVSKEPMLFDRKNKDLVEARPTAFLTIACNSMPRFTDKSDGIWRRAVIFQLKNQVMEQHKDPRLITVNYWEQSGELAGIFNLALAGMRRVAERGGALNIPESMRVESAMYREELNPVASFAKDYLNLDAWASDPAMDVYSAYKKMVIDHGHRPMAMVTFNRQLRIEVTKLGVSVDLHKTKTGKVWKGLGLNPVGLSFCKNVSSDLF